MKVKLDKGAFLPERAHPDDAGLDLRTPYPYRLDQGQCLTIDTGVHVQIPHGAVGLICGRSGLNVKYDIICPVGVIDDGYTGSLVVKLYNESEYIYPKIFEVGDKIAQLLIVPCLKPELEIVDVLDETERGDKGFGSSGE